MASSAASARGGPAANPSHLTCGRSLAQPTVGRSDSDRLRCGSSRRSVCGAWNSALRLRGGIASRGRAEGVRRRKLPDRQARPGGARANALLARVEQGSEAARDHWSN
jgi:hypothetical protein